MESGCRPKNHDLGFDRRVGQHLDGCCGRLDRQHNANSAVADDEFPRAFVEDVDERADDMRLAVERLEAGDVIGFDQGVFAGVLSDVGHLTRRRDERCRGDDDLFAGAAKPVGDLIEILLEVGLTLRADDLAQIDAIDGRFVGDLEVEVAALFGVPMIEERPQGQLRMGRFCSSGFHQRQPFLYAPVVCRFPSARPLRSFAVLLSPSASASTALRKALTTSLT